MSPTQYPTIGQIVDVGNTSSRSVFPLKKALVGLFKDSVAPLLLHSADELRRIKGVGQRGETVLKTGISLYGLSFRPVSVSVADYASVLYGSPHAVPIQALYVFVYPHEDTPCFEPHHAIDMLVACDPHMTLGELSALNRRALREHLKAHGITFAQGGQLKGNPLTYDEFVRVVRTRLNVFGLTLGKKASG